MIYDDSNDRGNDVIKFPRRRNDAPLSKVLHDKELAKQELAEAIEVLGKSIKDLNDGLKEVYKIKTKDNKDDSSKNDKDI